MLSEEAMSRAWNSMLVRPPWERRALAFWRGSSVVVRVVTAFWPLVGSRDVR